MTAIRDTATPAKVFISYAHEDEGFRDELVKHLRLLEREKLIEIWHDRKISAGQDWSQAIHAKLASATIVILMVSADFIDSDYCYGVEMTAALHAAERGDAQVVPVLVRHTAFDSAPFARLQMLPRDCVPVIDFPARDKAWTEVAAAIRELAIRQGGDGTGRTTAPVDSSAAPSAADWRRLGEALLARLRSLDRADDWVDQRFTDLPAEVEAESTVPKHRWRRLFYTRGRQLRRVPSLHAAIITTSDRLSLVIGDPGSGKSVAMRHAARQILERATVEQHPVLPLYVNLRDFPAPEHDITADTIREYVVTASCRDLETKAAAFLRRSFDWALTSGRLLVLLDSFDEIPEVLGSGEPDTTVTKYAEAIHTFASGMHDSRVVVSSRPYRGPGRMRWPQLRILPLGEERRREFIRAWFDDEAAAAAVRQELLRAVDLDGWIDNPLLLALLCAYRKAHGTLPRNAHEAFESFVSRRISSRPEVLEKHRLSPGDLRSATEQMAFTMIAEHSLGLAPEIDDLAQSMRQRGVVVAADLEAVVACVVDLNLGRAALEARSRRRVFSFFHRRVQEYFCTCCALRSPQQLNSSELIANERWRETAVTLLQTGAAGAVQPFLDAAQERLARYDAEIQRSLGLPLRDLHAATPLPVTLGRLRALHGPRPFPWPAGLIHLLGILSDYRMSAAAPELESVRRSADPCVLAALALGLRIDQATALQVSSAMSSVGRKCALSWAFTTDSRWLEDIAFERSSHVTQLPAVIVARIGSMLVLKQLTGELRRDRTRIEAQIRRVDAQTQLLDTFHALSRVVGVDFIVIGLLLALALAYAYLGDGSIAFAAFGGGLLAAMTYAVGSVGVRRRALRHWRDHSPDRGVLAANALVALASTVARTTVPGLTFAVAASSGELSAAVPIGAAGIMALLLGHRPGVYCAAISGRAVSPARELMAGVQPVVLLVGALASRVGAAVVIVLTGIVGFSVLSVYATIASLGGRPPEPVSESATLFMMTAVYGSGLLALLVYMGRRLADSMRLRRYQRRKDARSAVDALDEAASLRRENTRTRYFRWIRENELIAATRPNERVFVELLAALEDVTVVSDNGNAGQESKVNSGDFEAWFTAYAARHRRGLEDWTHSVDELAQLVDQLRARLGM